MEQINFKIQLHGTGWDDVYPECVVYINDQIQWHGNVINNTTVEFDIDLEDDSKYELKIQYLNRNTELDVVRDDTGNIVKNRQFEIESIHIDDIELDHYNILFTQGETSFVDYHYAQLHKQDPDAYPLVQTGNTVLGAECTWSLKFTTPFYIWLLENL